MCSVPVAPAEMEFHLQLCLEDTIVLSGAEEEVGIVLSGAPAEDEEEVGIVLSGAPADEEEEGAPGLWGEPPPEGEVGGAVPQPAAERVATTTVSTTAVAFGGDVGTAGARGAVPEAAVGTDAAGATATAVVTAAHDTTAGTDAGAAAASTECWEVPSQTQSEDGIQLLSDHDSEYGEEGGTAAKCSDGDGGGGA